MRKYDNAKIGQYEYRTMQRYDNTKIGQYEFPQNRPNNTKI